MLMANSWKSSFMASSRIKRPHQPYGEGRGYATTGLASSTSKSFLEKKQVGMQYLEKKLNFDFISSLSMISFLVLICDCSDFKFELPV